MDSDFVFSRKRLSRKNCSFRPSFEALEDRSVPAITATTTPFIVGADAGGGPHVHVFDARTGDPIYSFFAYDQSFSGGVRVALGDYTGDGVADILTGAGPGGGPHVKVFDGTTLAEVHSFFAFDPAFTGGVNVAYTPDLNGDGTPDIIVAADAGGGPHVKLFSGRDTSELLSFFAYDPSFLGGVSVTAGDIDGDGIEEIITGPLAGGGPHVKAFDVVTLAVERSFFAYDPSFLGGINVVAANVNRDDRVDIITAPGAGGGPHIRIFDGTTTDLIGEFFAADPNLTTGIRVSSWDVNDDGHSDIWIGHGPGGLNEVLLIDGAKINEVNSNGQIEDSARLLKITPFDPPFIGGVFVNGFYKKIITAPKL